jgi:hypothetical protein
MLWYLVIDVACFLTCACPVTVNLFISFTDSDTILIVGQWIVCVTLIRHFLFKLSMWTINTKNVSFSLIMPLYVKRVVHFFSPIKWLDVLNSNLKAETFHKHYNREKVQVLVCLIRFSAMVNSLIFVLLSLISSFLFPYYFLLHFIKSVSFCSTLNSSYNFELLKEMYLFYYLLEINNQFKLK